MTKMKISTKMKKKKETVNKHMETCYTGIQNLENKYGFYVYFTSTK